MTNKKSLIIGNWKMNQTVSEASMLVHKLSNQVAIRTMVEVVLCPTFLTLQPLSLQINHRQFKLGAQNCYWRDEGAYTGEVSAHQLRGLVQYVLVGHSERRYVFQEQEKDIRYKVQAVLRNEMTPVLCIGETPQQRADGETKHVIHDQIVSGLANVTSDEIGRIVIAYEPVWAIGTGKNATAADVEQVAAYIYEQVNALYGEIAANQLRVLYGGSVTDENAEQYLGLERVDGLLVGGASLNAYSFANIIDMAHNKRKDNRV